MSVTSAIRRSNSTVVPLAVRLLGGQTHNYYSGALFTAGDHSRKLLPNDLLSFPSVYRYSSSASPESNPPSSDESLSESSNRRSNALNPASRSKLDANLRAIFNKYAETKCMYRSVVHEGKNQKKRKLKKTELPTHYMEVNYRTLKAVVFYGPNVNHVPHKLRSKNLV